MKSLTISMPALNEADAIETTLVQTYSYAKELLDEFEIIVVDDGSSDDTYHVATATAKKLGPEIMVIRKSVNEGTGFVFKTVLDHARYEYIVDLPGDNPYSKAGVRMLFDSVGKKPIILGYRTNMHERPFLRYFLSSCVKCYIELLTGKKIKDDGPVITPVNLSRQYQFSYAKYNFHMQRLCFVLSKNIEYLEVPVPYSDEADKHSGMIRFRVLFDVILSSLQLLFLKLFNKL